jgi:Fe-Mn family superoxide dismutase
MPYEAKKFDSLVGIEGLSETMLNNHFTLYEGYVKNVNKLLEILDSKEPGTPEYSELQRRLGWEFDGMRLHELYFENISIGGSVYNPDSKIALLINKIYGSFENWKKNFVAVATMRGVGWVVLYYDPKNNELFNAWISEHDGGHLVGCIPLLVIDVWEHAYLTDYGIKRADYVEKIIPLIDWAVVESRYK